MTLPAYLSLYESGELQARVSQSEEILSSCHLCPHHCQVNRLADEKGVCKTGSHAVLASYSPHFGEESPLVGQYGSGTIFFSYCNLGCVFCQNFEISHNGEGFEVTSEQLAAVMLNLQKQGCHNINFVTPSHVVPQILAALQKAIPQGLKVPLVYNSSGYDSVETLQLLNNVVDIYMPDFKFWSELTSKKYTSAKNYQTKAKAAIHEMFNQVGDLKIDRNQIAVRGLLVRHLVMPDGNEETEQILSFIANEISQNTYINIMDQYRPCGKAAEHNALNRRLRQNEYQKAMDCAARLGLKRVDRKDWSVFFRNGN